MRNKLMTFSLFFPEPMDAEDVAHLGASGCKRIQMTLSCASNPGQVNQLQFLKGQAVSVALRLDEPSPGQEAGSYYDAATHQNIISQIQTVQALITVEAVIIGNEPENLDATHYDLTWFSGNWGNMPDGAFQNVGGKARAHASAVAVLGPRLKALGVQVVSPGWSHKRIVPRDQPQPGRATWRELCLNAYNACDANGVHLYAHNWASPEDENRYLWSAGFEIERCHRTVWINETNVNRGSAEERLLAVRRMYDLLAQQPWAIDRVQSFCLFTANGTGIGYSPGLIIKSLQAYQDLGVWLHT